MEIKDLIFNQRSYHVGFERSGDGTDYSSDGYEWVTAEETVENWTTLVTTIKLSPLSVDRPLNAEAYAQNAANLNAQKGALVLETSIINQNMEELGIDPAHPPFLLAYMFDDGQQIEFNMQKITQLNETELGIIIYAERFPHIDEAGMKAYYESKERTDKRVELLRLPFPY